MTSYFNSKKISPNPATPEQKAYQLQKLQENQTDSYFMEQKAAFIEAGVASGYNKEQVEWLVNGQGVADINSYQYPFSLDPNYINSLKAWA